MNNNTIIIEETDQTEVAAVLDSIAEHHINCGFAVTRFKDGSTIVDDDYKCSLIKFSPCIRGIKVDVTNYKEVQA